MYRTFFFLMTMFLFCLFKFSIFPHKNEVQLYGICKEKFKIPKHPDFETNILIYLYSIRPVLVAGLKFPCG